jgi:hypothetical protein
MFVLVELYDITLSEGLIAVTLKDYTVIMLVFADGTRGGKFVQKLHG